jgi:exodeoxyribonuclease III
MPVSLATWNINSVRLRIDLVRQFLSEHKPDILCLQEIKCQNDQFPAKALISAGYPYQAVHGQKGYHGVAIVSRLPLSETRTRQFCGIEDSRHVSVSVDLGDGPVTLHDFYIPAGGDIPDSDKNPKFRHKLDFLAELKDWFDTPEFAERQVIVGDFNIAPHEMDVWSHKQLLDVVSHTPIETEALDELRDRRPWTDLVRKHIPYDEKIYSWWSYRARDWEASDRGRRLDHIWATPDVAAGSTSAEILRSWRGTGEKPSDHVPVMVRFG